MPGEYAGYQENMVDTHGKLWVITSRSKSAHGTTGAAADKSSCPNPTRAAPSTPCLEAQEDDEDEDADEDDEDEMDEVNDEDKTTTTHDSL